MWSFERQGELPLPPVPENGDLPFPESRHREPLWIQFSMGVSLLMVLGVWGMVITEMLKD